MDTPYSEQMMIEIKQILNNAIDEENLNYIYDALDLLDNVNKFGYDSYPDDGDDNFQ